MSQKIKPSPPGIVPRKLRSMEGKKFETQDFQDLCDLKSTTPRLSPVCLICARPNEKLKVGLCLCCVNLACKECVSLYNENHDKSCPYCGTSWAPFRLRDVYLPVRHEGWSVSEELKISYREQWLRLLHTHDLLNHTSQE